LHYQYILIAKYTNIMLNTEKKVQLNVKIPISVRYELEEVMLARKKRGEKVNLINILVEYVQSGIETDKKKQASFNYTLNPYQNENF